MLTTFVVPCFNEEQRLPAADILALAEANDVRLLLVDDGSTDQTRARLLEIANASRGRGSVAVLGLDVNVGKGEAVRRGLIEVSTQAVTSADGDIGDVVQVLLRPSGRALRAQLVARDRSIAVEDGR